MIVAIITHIRVVTALQSQEHGRAFNRTGHVIKSRFYTMTRFVYHLHKQLVKRFTILWQQLADLQGYRLRIR